MSWRSKVNRGNSRWVRPEPKVSPIKREEPPTNNRWQRPSTPIKRVVKKRERSWEEIMNDKDEYKPSPSSILNPSIPKEGLDIVIKNLLNDRRSLKENVRRYNKDIIEKKYENEKILKQRDVFTVRLKNIDLDILNNTETKVVKMSGIAADKKLRKEIGRSNRQKNIKEEMTQLKNKFVENRKFINKYNTLIEAHLRDIDLITERLDELIKRLDSESSFMAVIPKVEQPIELKEDSDQEEEIITPTEWWKNDTAKPLNVQMLNWSPLIKRAKKNFTFEFSEEETSVESSEEEKKVVEEIITEEPTNPYMSWSVEDIKKRVRFYNKKLRQISKLIGRDDLNEEQLNKIKKKEEFEYELKLLNEIKQS